ncbi:carbapenem self-resistance protein CarG family protein [Erwinia sp.]|uniref:carbapenem self-resistance protein CarG family protein n=1 Tax=Erwinia citreus TaxID=558 RepID=UPI003916E622
MNKFFMAALLFSGQAFASPEEMLLKNGENIVDINSDGIKDIIFIANYDNNTSHPSRTMNVFISNKQGDYNSIPCPQASGFTWADVSLSASGVKIYDYKLVNYQNRYFMVSAEKADIDKSGDIADSAPVRINRYVIAQDESDPGIPAFQWRLAGSYITEKKFEDVTDALKKLNMDDFK